MAQLLVWECTQVPKTLRTLSLSVWVNMPLLVHYIDFPLREAWYPGCGVLRIPCTRTPWHPLLEQESRSSCSQQWLTYGLFSPIGTVLRRIHFLKYHYRVRNLTSIELICCIIVLMERHNTST